MTKALESAHKGVVENPAHKILAEQEAKVADLRKKIEREEAVLHGMRLVVDTASGLGNLFHGPLSATPSPVLAEVAKNALRRGRQPGAISHEWRNALGLLYWRNPGGFSVDHVVAAAHANGLPNTRSKEAEDRMRAYIEHGYVERHGDGYRVTEMAANKYQFSRRETTEAPTADAEGAS